MMEHPNDGAGEKREAFPVVEIAIEIRTVEILFVIKEIPDYAVEFQRKQAAIDMAPSQIDIIITLKFQLISEIFAYPPVQGASHGHFRALFYERYGKGAGYIAEAASLAERRGLTGNI